ncbi:MAG: radical SAM family heme chaperone HemW [Elusimicrobiota bacterium]|jgi:oxygen-independent coproporphyrinogen-3 oxidase
MEKPAGMPVPRPRLGGEPIASEAPLGLYVHVPFCSGKCGYCDFTSYPGRETWAPRYLAALEAEAALLPRYGTPDTVYIGGGTPSQLSAAQISELFIRLGRAYPGMRPGEVTFEANPESLDAAKTEVLRACGVTRLSLGLQTPDEAILRGIARRHTWTDAVRAYDLARRAGKFSVAVDLICGLPGQSREDFVYGLRQVLALAPDHVSVYGLDLHPGTPLAEAGYHPDEDAERDMLESALDTMAEYGFEHYEISNFARPGQRSQHNLNYWSGGQYVGLGCGASGHLAGARWRNHEDLAAYCGQVERGVRPTTESERLSGKDKLGERVFLGLRLTEGLEVDPDMEREFAREWQDLERRGLVTRSGGRARLTREGIFLANEAFASFVAPFEVKL